jgi:hypothetical protein
MSRSRRSRRAGVLLVLGGLAILLVPGHRSSMAQEKKKVKPVAEAKMPLEGAWRLVSSKNPATGQQRALPATIEMTKLVVGGRYIWNVVQDGKAIAGAGGKYTRDGDSYTETVTYTVASDQRSTEFLVGKSFTFTWKLVDGKWLHRGKMKLGASEQQIDEVWEPIP